MVFELERQPSLLYDFNQEAIGFNKRTDERVVEYIKRVMNDDILNRSKDYGFAEFCPVH